MRENLRSVFCLAVLAFCAAPLGFAQNLEVKTPSDLSSRNRDAIEVTRDQVRSDRKALVAKAMKLTDDKAQAFWRFTTSTLVN